MDLTTELIRYSQFIGLFLAASFCLYSVSQHKQRGAKSLGLMFAGISLWVAAAIIQVQTPATTLPAVGVEFRLIGPDLTVLGLLLFALEFTGRERWFRPKVLAILAIKPLCTAALALSPYRDLLVTANPDATTLFGYDFALTPLFVGYTVYNWMLTAIALVLLGQMMVRANEGYKRQIGVLAVGISVPFLVNIAYHANLFGVDVTSASFLATASLFLFAVFRLRLLDAIPIARRTVLEEMDDAVLVLDENDTIITANETAREKFNMPRIVGTSAVDVLGTRPGTWTDGDTDSLSVEVDGETRYFDITRSELTDYRENVLARVLVCRDVTEKREREAELRRREEELDLLKTLQSRFLRHNLRNKLNVVQVNARRIADTDDPEDCRRYQQIEAKTERLLEWSSKARMIEGLIETDELVVRDLSVMAESVSSELRGTYPEAVFELDLTPETDAVVVPQIDRALQNILDNAVRHNDAEQPVVEITTRMDGDQARISITDNGPGLADHEIETILSGAESALQHTSGFGLWLVYWVANRSNAELSFETNDGTTVELTFDTAHSHPLPADGIALGESSVE